MVLYKHIRFAENRMGNPFGYFDIAQYRYAQCGQVAHPCIFRYGSYTRDSFKIQDDKAWACPGARKPEGSRIRRPLP
jgi:hypothetical protein